MHWARPQKAIPTMEYLVLLGVTVASVLYALNVSHTNAMRRNSKKVFDKVSKKIMEKRPVAAFGLPLSNEVE